MSRQSKLLIATAVRCVNQDAPTKHWDCVSRRNEGSASGKYKQTAGHDCSSRHTTNQPWHNHAYRQCTIIHKQRQHLVVVLTTALLRSSANISMKWLVFDTCDHAPLTKPKQSPMKLRKNPNEVESIWNRAVKNRSAVPVSTKNARETQALHSSNATILSFASIDCSENLRRS